MRDWHTSIMATVDAVARFTGQSPIVSASALSSHDRYTAAALWRHSPKTRTFEGHECDILAISLRGNATLEQLENGRSVWRGPAPGSIVLLQAGDPTDWHLDGQFEMLHVYLSEQVSKDPGIRNSFRRPFRDPVLVQLARSISLALTDSGGSARYVSPLLDGLEKCLVERHLNFSNQGRSDQPSGLTGFARARIMTLVDESLQQDLSSEVLAKAANLSVGHFNRAFKESFGTTPHQYILETRVARAAQLLSMSDLDINSIARACGFSGGSHLSTEFRRRMGVTPSTYRRAG